MVTVTGPFSPGQLSDWNFARPVESVSTWQGAGSDESPTRTLALETAGRVSSSITYTNRLPLTLPSATPPPGIILGSGGPLTPPQLPAAVTNPMKMNERSFLI